MVIPPVGWIGLSSARTMTPSTSGGAMSARFSAIVLPVTVRQSPCMQPGVQQRLHHHRHAADPVDVVHHVAAERLEVAQVRHLLAHPDEVVQGQVTSASLAMASRCSTALVEPPKAITTAMAFSNASLVRICRAVMPWRSSSTTAMPLRRA